MISKCCSATCLGKFIYSSTTSRVFGNQGFIFLKTGQDWMFISFYFLLKRYGRDHDWIPMHFSSQFNPLKRGGSFCFYHEWSQIVSTPISSLCQWYIMNYNGIIFPQKVVNRRDIPCLFWTKSIVKSVGWWIIINYAYRILYIVSCITFSCIVFDPICPEDT